MHSTNKIGVALASIVCIVSLFASGCRRNATTPQDMEKTGGKIELESDVNLTLPACPLIETVGAQQCISATELTGITFSLGCDNVNQVVVKNREENARAGIKRSISPAIINVNLITTTSLATLFTPETTKITTDCEILNYDQNFRGFYWEKRSNTQEVTDLGATCDISTFLSTDPVCQLATCRLKKLAGDAWKTQCTRCRTGLEDKRCK